MIACSERDDDWGYVPVVPPPAATGTLEYRWSINGRHQAEDCDTVGAVLFESLVADEGFLIDRVSAPCEDFEASLPLYPDDFRARSALTDASGLLAVGRVTEDVFLIEDGKVTTLVMDFLNAAVPMDPAADAGVPDVADAAVPEPVVPEPADAGTDAGT
jgi:hypothetical protein